MNYIFKNDLRDESFSQKFILRYRYIIIPVKKKIKNRWIIVSIGELKARIFPPKKKKDFSSSQNNSGLAIIVQYYLATTRVGRAQLREERGIGLNAIHRATTHWFFAPRRRGETDKLSKLSSVRRIHERRYTAVHARDIDYRGPCQERQREREKGKGRESKGRVAGRIERKGTSRVQEAS